MSKRKITFDVVDYSKLIEGCKYVADIIGVEPEKVLGWIGWWCDDKQRAKLEKAGKDYYAFYALSVDDRVKLLNEKNHAESMASSESVRANTESTERSDS